MNMVDKDVLKNMCEIAFWTSRPWYSEVQVDSLIFVYTDTIDVSCPYFNEEDAEDAYNRAIATGRPFVIRPWFSK